MWKEQLKVAIEAALLAKEEIMKVYAQQFDVEIKDDNSPVTIAEKNAEKIIREYLHSKYPEYGMLTEESNDDKTRLTNDYIWIVDPVDGTKDFVARDNEFTTNIALAYKGEVVVGVVNVPANNEMYFAAQGAGAFFKNDLGKVESIHVNEKINDLTILVSRFHTTTEEEAYIEKHANKIKHLQAYGSSIKPCRIARGLAELHVRLSAGTKEWDTAASQCIVEEAGGAFVNAATLKPLTYNREDVYNREGYIVANSWDNIFSK